MLLEIGVISILDAIRESEINDWILNVHCPISRNAQTAPFENRVDLEKPIFSLKKRKSKKNAPESNSIFAVKVAALQGFFGPKTYVTASSTLSCTNMKKKLQTYL